MLEIEAGQKEKIKRKRRMRKSDRVDKKRKK